MPRPTARPDPNRAHTADKAAGAGAAADAPSARLTRGLDAFVDACLGPEHQRIRRHQAPVALGWDRCRELEARVMKLLDAMLQELATAGG